jgi:protein TonB
MDRLARPGGLTSRRNLLIASSVVAFHAAALWALQTGLLRRAVEVVVPVAMLSEIVTPPEPKVEPMRAPRPPEPVARKMPPAPAPAPRPVAQPDPAPSPRAVTATVEPSPAPPPVQASAPPAPPAPAAPEPPKVQLPSSDADYLQNPKPAYPPISKRLGEQGKVVVRVLIAADGTAQQAEVRQSSGFDRLDQAALQTVLKWRYVPGKRAGVAEAMWFNVPIQFVLE